MKLSCWWVYQFFRAFNFKHNALGEAIRGTLEKIKSFLTDLSKVERLTKQVTHKKNRCILDTLKIQSADWPLFSELSSYHELNFLRLRKILKLEWTRKLRAQQIPNRMRKEGRNWVREWVDQRFRKIAGTAERSWQMVTSRPEMP